MAWGGTPVAIGDTLDFSSQMIFSGATQFSFTQELIPTPEPGTFGLLAMSGLLLSGFAFAKRRRGN